MAHWTKAELAKLEKLQAKGLDFLAIANSLGRSYDSVRLKIRALQRSAPPSEEIKEAAHDYENVALKYEIEELEKKLDDFKQHSVAPEWDDDWDGKDEWSRAEERGKKKIERATKQGRFDVSFPDGPIAISCISDQHIAPGTACDFKRMREDAELIRNTPGFYAVFCGDGVDNHLKHRSAMMHASSNPDEQWRLFDYYLQLFGDKILAIISGNHDAWTAQIGGIDYLSKLAEKRKVCYAPAEARLAVTVAGQEYKMVVRHQAGRFNSSLNQTHVVKRFYENNDEIFDIGVIGHHHEAAIEMFIRHGKKRYAARPGSYQITTPYAHQYGFGKSIPTCPTFVLFPGERRIIGFADVRDAAWCWGKVG